MDKKTQKKYQEKLTLECINQIRKGYKDKNIKLINRTVQLLLTFFDRFEGKGRITKNDKQQRRNQNVFNIKVKLLPDDLEKTFYITIKDTMRTLK